MVDGVGGKPLLEARVRLRADGSALGQEAVSETQKAARQAADVAGRELSRGFREGGATGARAAAQELKRAGTGAGAEGARAGKAFGDGFTRDAKARVQGQELLRGAAAREASAAAASGRTAGKAFGEAFVVDAQGVVTAGTAAISGKVGATGSVAAATTGAIAGQTFGNAYAGAAVDQLRQAGAKIVPGGSQPAAIGEAAVAGATAGAAFGRTYVSAATKAIGAGNIIQGEVISSVDAPATAAGARFGSRFGAKASSAIQDEFRTQASGIGKTIIGAIALEKGIGLLEDSVTVASDLNEVGSALNVTFGAEGAASITKWSETTAKGFGLATLASQEANSQFGIFAKSAGLTGDKAVQFSTTLTGLAGDLTSFYNPAGGAAQSIEAIGAALRGESEPIRAFGVLLDDATLRQEALRLGLVKTTKDALTPQQRVLAAYSQILKQTSAAQGDFARTSDSLANTQRSLGNEFQDLKTTLGEGLAPVVGDTTKGLKGVITQVNAIPADGVAGKLKPLLFGGIGQFSIAYNGIRDGIEKVRGESEKVPPAAARMELAIRSVSTAMGENGGAAERNGESTARLYTLYDGTAAKAAEFARQQARLAKSLTSSPFLEARDAARAYEQALDDTAKAAKENGAGLDITTQKGRDNQEALDGLADAALSYLDSINRQKGPGKEFQSALKQQRADLIRAGIQFGLRKEDARAYADRILRIPKKAVTSVTLAGVSAVNYSLDTLLTRVNSLDGRRIQIYSSAANVREGRSKGGPVPGRPSEVDSLPYMLAPGEFVVRSREASKPQNRAVLEAMNAGQPYGSAPGSAGVSGGGASIDHDALAAAVTRGVAAALAAQGTARVVLDDAVVGRIVRAGGGLAGVDAGGW